MMLLYRKYHATGRYDHRHLQTPCCRQRGPAGHGEEQKNRILPEEWIQELGRLGR